MGGFAFLAVDINPDNLSTPSLLAVAVFIL